MRAARLATSFVALLSALVAARAEAFVREVHLKTSAPVFWKESCVPITIYLNGFNEPRNKGGVVVKDQLSLAGIEKSVVAAAHAWSADAVSCPSGGAPSLEIVPTIAPAGAAAPVGYDAKNVVIFRTDVWALSGVAGPMRDYAPEGLAVTTVTSSGDGHIVDVDVEINATNALNVWMDLDPGVIPPAERVEGMDPYDLQSALTHEFGHFIGLAHTCLDTGGAASDVDATGTTPGKDDQGRPVPDCAVASSAENLAVMYPVVEARDVSKRALSADDVRAVCAIYPPSRPDATCALDAPPGCAVEAPRRRGALVLVALVGVGALVEGARRRRVSGRGRARS